MSRRNAIAAAIEAHNLAHPTARLPRPAARLLAVMFATEDVCCLSQETLRIRGFGNRCPRFCTPWSRPVSSRGSRARRRQSQAASGPDSQRHDDPLRAESMSFLQ
jgi:hypothetical protein